MWVLHSRWANCRARSAGHFGLVCHPCSYPEIRGWRDPQQYQPVSLMDHMIMNQGRCSGASMVYAHPAGQAWRSQRQCNGMVFEVGGLPKDASPTPAHTSLDQFL